MHTCETIPEIKIESVIPESTPVPFPRPPLHRPISLWADTGLLSATPDGPLDCHTSRLAPLAPEAVFTQPDLTIAVPFTVAAPSLLRYQEVIPFYC